ncbi:MAG: adenosine nucleotide hydrolase, partial [Hymenobacter sp.]|nr:adenosine nucleotide hydrolase [Hymenobacter sp.]
MAETGGFVSSWSGGKDSCFAFMQAARSGLQPKVLLNMLNENGRVSRSHAIARPVLARQAA